MQINNHHTDSNISALNEGLKLLNLLNDDQYNASFKPAFESTIGAHFRHVLEHYQCFFAQIDSQHFCYDLRQRNMQLETNLSYAKTIVSELINLIQAMDVSADSKSYYLSDESINAKIKTSLLRELAFLQTHTTHHYAIIAAIARTLGVQPQADFGVAIATRNHQLQVKKIGQQWN